MCALQAVVKVQDTVFTAALSGNWNVSFHSTALQLSLDLVGNRAWHGQLDDGELYIWSICVD